MVDHVRVKSAERFVLRCLVEQIVRALPYIPCDFAEHPGSIVMLGDARYYLGDSQVSGGRGVVVPVQELGALVSRDILLPLVFRRGLLEVELVEYVSVESVSFYSVVWGRIRGPVHGLLYDDSSDNRPC